MKTYKIPKKLFNDNFVSKFHQPLSTYVKFVKPKKINNLFTIVRDPYTRIKSIYFYSKKYGCKLDFKSFVETGYFKKNKIFPHFSKRQVDYLDAPKLKKKLIILKLENPRKILKFLNSRFSLELKSLPIINKNKYNNVKLTKKQIKIINDYYKDDFIKLKYKML